MPDHTQPLKAVEIFSEPEIREIRYVVNDVFSTEHVPKIEKLIDDKMKFWMSESKVMISEAVASGMEKHSKACPKVLIMENKVQAIELKVHRWAWATIVAVALTAAASWAIAGCQVVPRTTITAPENP